MPDTSEETAEGLKPWRVTASRYVLESPWMNVRADTCLTAEAATIDPFYVLEVPDFVHVVPFDRDGRLLITRLYRHGNGDIHHEIPCGGVESGDASPLSAAQRELLEETGCVAEDYVELPGIFVNPARQNNRIHTFVARNVRAVTAPKEDPGEKIEWRFMEVEQVLQLVAQGEFPNALLVASLMMVLSGRFH
jgi:8-oxo-dGTP pyrophosphatase MutT (NUDIX family)